MEHSESHNPIKYLFALLACFVSCFLIAQPKGEITFVDSLKAQLQLEQEEAEKLNVYLDLTKTYFFQQNVDSTIHYATLGEKLALKENNESIYASLLYYGTNIKNNISREDALENYEKVAEIASRLRGGKLQLNVHNRLIELYANFGNYEQVKKHVEISSNILDTIDVEPKLLLHMKGDFHLVWAFANTRLHKYENTIVNYKKAKEYFIELEDHFEIAKSNFNISVEFMKQNELDSATVYLESAKEYFDSVDHDFGKAMVNSELGALYIRKEELTKGIEILHKAVAICEKIKLNQPLDATYSHLGVAYGKLEDYEKAIFYEKKALQLNELLKDTSSLILGNKFISGYYEAIGDYRNAFDHQKEFLALNEPKLEIENKQMLEEVEAKYQVKEKESQIELKNVQLTQQKNINIGIGVLAGLLLAIAFLIRRTALQRKRTNNELKRLDSAKSNFFANISHELRTPLTLILAPLEKAIENVKSKSVKEDLLLAHSNSKKLTTLVNEIMDLSKLESGKMQLKETAVDLERLSRRIFFSYQSLAQVSGFALNFEYQLQNILGVNLDIEKFEKILNNLLSNAFKHTKPGGTINMTVSDNKGNLQVEIKDSGRGISDKNQEKIFNRYYQIENETEPLQGGTGIGLAYAKEIALLFGGDLRVESELGKGSNFILTMPLKKSDLNKIFSEETSEETESSDASFGVPVYALSNEKPHLLIVEDNLEMSKFLVRTLSDQFQCSTAMDGIEALQKLENEKFDLITSDVMMPNMDGFTFLEKVHEREDFLTTPVVMLTARTLEEDKLRGLQLGVDDYLTKPFNTKELIARINNLLKNKSEREQWHLENSTSNSEKVEEEKPISFEKKLLKTAEDLVLKNLSNSNFKITEFARELNYSQRQVERIMKKLTGFSPVGFVREIRLQKAYQMIESRQFATISEVRFEVGMENASYFTKKFQERFGKSPNEV